MRTNRNFHHLLADSRIGFRRSLGRSCVDAHYVVVERKLSFSRAPCRTTETTESWNARSQLNARAIVLGERTILALLEMTGLNFNTANSTFRQVMGNGLVYRVPPFQRDYSWTGDEWDDLWQDVMGLLGGDAEPAHYMGYLVVQTTDNKRFDVIDGQQRLTTLSTLILAAISHLNELSTSAEDEQERRANQLRNSYIGFLDPVTLVPQSKLTLNRHNDRFYQDYLVPLVNLPQRGLNASEHLLRKSFQWFKERIEHDVEIDGEAIARFVDQIVDKLFFTVITVNDELNAFKVFETLNARGVRLSSTDLLKNYLFSIVSTEGSHTTELKTLEERWDAIVGLLGSESFPEFLRVFWNSRNRLVRKSNLFKTIRREIRSKAQAFELVRDLDRHARVYAALRDPSDEEWQQKEREYLRQLQMFNVTQPLAMLLATHDKFVPDRRREFEKVLRATAVLSFRYNVICTKLTSEQETTYNGIAQSLAGGNINSSVEVLGLLAPLYPQDQEFKATFAEKELRTSSARNNKVVRYILFELEKHMSGQEFEFETARYSVEHVLPERPSADWGQFDEHRHERCVYRLGNMTPLLTNKNRELGNAGFCRKTSLVWRK